MLVGLGEFFIVRFEFGLNEFDVARRGVGGEGDFQKDWSTAKI